LSGTPPNLIYTPHTGYEGTDGVQLAVSDGVWTSSAASVTIYVSAGPVLSPNCDPFGTAVQLDWSLDTNEQAMFPNPGSLIRDFIVYDSASSGGPYTVISTNASTGDTSWMTYRDTNAMAGQTNYYVVTFELPDYTTGITYESPFSNEIEVTGHNPDNLIPANAVWQVVTDTNYPSIVTNLQAPFSSDYPNQYPGIYPWPNTNWPTGTQDDPSVWSNHIVLYVPTNVVLSQVQYSIAIDNDYSLYLNGSNIETFTHEDLTTWRSLQSFDSVATNVLHWGTNDLDVEILDRGQEDYFSMIVTTNTCGW
jgi:hypothetical protein